MTETEEERIETEDKDTGSAVEAEVEEEAAAGRDLRCAAWVDMLPKGEKEERMCVREGQLGPFDHKWLRRLSSESLHDM